MLANLCCFVYYCRPRILFKIMSLKKIMNSTGPKTDYKLYQQQKSPLAGKWKTNELTFHFILAGSGYA